jgi:hypothetical protein
LSAALRNPAGFRAGREPAAAATGSRSTGSTHPDSAEAGFLRDAAEVGRAAGGAVIYQLCPMVIPQPANIAGPLPEDWCRSLDRSPRWEARLDGKRVDLDRVWTARSLRPLSRAEFEFRSGPLRRWARENASAPEARPHRPVDLGAIPPLF